MEPAIEPQLLRDHCVCVPRVVLCTKYVLLYTDVNSATYVT